MTSQQDKNVRSKIITQDSSPIILERHDFTYVSPFLERLREGGIPFPSWEEELGNRIKFLANRIGKDNCVLITGKSWKQIGRYFVGKEPPVGVIKAFGDAKGVSLSYLVDGIIELTIDSEIERTIIDYHLKHVRKALDCEKNEHLRKILRDTEKYLLSRSLYLVKLGLALINKERYPRTYNDLIDEEQRQVEGAVIDGEHLQIIIEEVEAFLENRGMRMDSKHKSALISTIYAGMLEEDLIESRTIQSVIAKAVVG